MNAWLTKLLAPAALKGLAHRVWTRDFRAALLLCLPALVAGLALRICLLVSMPAAFVHSDTPPLVRTAHTLLTQHALEIDGKKTFLAPLFYSLPALLHVPILPVAAVVQHLLGLLDVVVCGLLAFAWFRFWRWLIVPVTIAVALDPVLLWYEHAALTETWAVTGILLVALTGTAYWRAPGRHTLFLLLLATLFAAGTRPEGCLLSLFTIALVARTLWGNWRKWSVAMAISSLWAFALFVIVRTSQSGLLLFTSVLHLAPAHLIFSPGVAEAIAPVAAEARANWARRDPNQLTPLRKALEARLIALQISWGVPPRQARKRVNSIAGRAAAEIVARNLPVLPMLALRKFLLAHREPACGDFDRYPFTGQLRALYRHADDLESQTDAPLLWGATLGSLEETRSFLRSVYHPLPSLSGYLRAFSAVWLAPICGVPWLYICALLGLLAMAIRERALGYHQLWAGFLVLLWLVIMVTANIRARFRILFEPFWFLYALALIDSACILAARFLPRRAGLRSR
jgi:hypothetical protein